MTQSDLIFFQQSVKDLCKSTQQPYVHYKVFSVKQNHRICSRIVPCCGLSVVINKEVSSSGTVKHHLPPRRQRQTVCYTRHCHFTPDGTCNIWH